MKDAIDLANYIAPEHLELSVENPGELVGLHLVWRGECIDCTSVVTSCLMRRVHWLYQCGNLLSNEESVLTVPVWQHLVWWGECIDCTSVATSCLMRKVYWLYQYGNLLTDEESVLIVPVWQPLVWWGECIDCRLICYLDLFKVHKILTDLTCL